MPAGPSPPATPPSPAPVAANTAVSTTQRSMGGLPPPESATAIASNGFLAVDCVVGRSGGSTAEAISVAQATERADGPYADVDRFGSKAARLKGHDIGIGVLPPHGDEMVSHPAAAAMKAAITAGAAQSSLLAAGWCRV